MFIFKGKNSNEMGVYVREENFLGKAPMRYDSIEIEGKHGADLVELGYQNFEGTLNDVVIMNDNFDEVLNWLSGSGELIYMGKKTRIHFLDAYQIAKHKKTFSIPFIREPFWYDLEDDYSEAWGANLIPNGWDDFQPYGSGEILYQSDFEDVWSKDGQVTGSHKKGHITTNEDGYYGMYRNLSIGEATYVTIELKTFVAGKFYVKYGNAPADGLWKDIINDGEFHTYDFQLFDIGNNNLIVSVFNKGEYEFRNIKVSKLSDRHLVVEKTPLENDLIRIQTWGGTSRIKLRHPNGLLTGITSTFSVFIDSIFSPDKPDVHNNATGAVIMNDKEFLTFKTDSANSNAVTRYQIRTEKANDNLDFIASTPVLVEGDTPPTWEADSNPRIINEGTAPSKPLIKLTKGTSSTCEFEVNGVYFKYHFNNDDHVIINCEEMEATYNGLPRNRHLTIGFEFPTLKVGDNVVKNISGDAKIEFKRKDRWL